jgi:hypothetical protein
MERPSLFRFIPSAFPSASADFAITHMFQAVKANLEAKFCWPKVEHHLMDLSFMVLVLLALHHPNTFEKATVKILVAAILAGKISLLQKNRHL